MFPPEKGGHPFAGWSVDTIVKLTPPSPSGAQDVVVFVDPFTKWVEVEAIDKLDS